MLINHELQGFSSDNFQTYAAARQNHPVYGPALKNIMQLMQKPPSTDDKFAKRLHTVFPYYMHDPNKAYLFDAALNGGSISAWNFVNQGWCDSELKYPAVEGLRKVHAHTLVINGWTYGICSEAAARKVAEELGSRAKLILIEEAGHVTWLEKPHEFFFAVKKFLNNWSMVFLPKKKKRFHDKTRVA